MFSRTLPAIQRNQMLFVAVFSVTLCACIAARTAVLSREILAANQAMLAASAEMASSTYQPKQGLIPLSAAANVSAVVSNGDPAITYERRGYCATPTVGNYASDCVTIQVDGPVGLVNERGAIAPLTSELALNQSMQHGIGLWSLLGWISGSTLFALACVAVADRRRSRSG